jgi:hypothetical protein
MPWNPITIYYNCFISFLIKFILILLPGGEVRVVCEPGQVVVPELVITEPDVGRVLQTHFKLSSSFSFQIHLIFVL